MSLIACTDCQRHVRSNEPSCPFCGAAVVEPPTAPRRTVGRLGRAALFAFGATLSTTAGCVGVPAYGSPALPDAGADAASIEPDAGSSVALYGGAPEP